MRRDHYLNEDGTGNMARGYMEKLGSQNDEKAQAADRRFRSVPWHLKCAMKEKEQRERQ